MPPFSFPSDVDPLYGCLASQHGFGHAGMAKLLARFGSAEGVYGAGPEAWRAAHPHASDAMIASLARGPDLRVWERLREDCAARRTVVAAPGWPGYPRVLEELDAPPPLLYLRGAWKEEDRRAVALVGTRTPTAYGREAARAFSRDLAAGGYTVVSGLALGIDAAAHQAALDAGGRTLAVIGCGLDLDYPMENRAIRRRIDGEEDGPGAVISEFPPGTPAWPSHFPRRNRLISALSRAIVVVEAGGKSGALLTADYARAQERLLFAVPGPIFSGVSAGSNALLSAGARPAISIADVIAAVEDLSPLTTRTAPIALSEAGNAGKLPTQGVISARVPPARRAASTQRKSGHEVLRKSLREPVRDPVLALWDTEEADEACPLDTLAARAEERGLWPHGRAAAALLEALLQLEMRGLVRRLPGAAYRRV